LLLTQIEVKLTSENTLFTRYTFKPSSNIRKKALSQYTQCFGLVYFIPISSSSATTTNSKTSLRNKNNILRKISIQANETGLSFPALGAQFRWPHCTGQAFLAKDVSTLGAHRLLDHVKTNRAYAGVHVPID